MKINKQKTREGSALLQALNAEFTQLNSMELGAPYSPIPQLQLPFDKISKGNNKQILSARPAGKDKSK